MLKLIEITRDTPCYTREGVVWVVYCDYFRWNWLWDSTLFCFVTVVGCSPVHHVCRCLACSAAIRPACVLWRGFLFAEYVLGIPRVSSAKEFRRQASEPSHACRKLSLHQQTGLHPELLTPPTCHSKGIAANHMACLFLGWPISMRWGQLLASNILCQCSKI